MKARRQGTWIHYSLAQGDDKTQDKLLRFLKDLSQDLPAFSKDRATLRSIARNRARCA